MIDYSYYERDEVIRPKKRAEKKAVKKSDHKHTYTKTKQKWMEASNIIVLKETCTICGREGKLHFLREELNHE